MFKKNLLFNNHVTIHDAEAVHLPIMQWLPETQEEAVAKLNGSQSFVVNGSQSVFVKHAYNVAWREGEGVQRMEPENFAQVIIRREDRNILIGRDRTMSFGDWIVGLAERAGEPIEVIEL